MDWELVSILLAVVTVIAAILWAKIKFRAWVMRKEKREWDAWLAQGPSLQEYREKNPQAVRGSMAKCNDCGGRKIAMFTRGRARSSFLAPVDVYRAHNCTQCGKELWRTIGKGDPHAHA